jgi:ribonuclease E
VRNVPRPTPNGDPRTPTPSGGTGNRSLTDRRSASPPVEDRGRATLVSSKFTPPEIEAYVSEPLPPDSADLTEVVDPSGDRERPGKPQRVKPTRPTIEPPEVVAIEMSDLEKETYAWMGVSPLVKLGRELNNPKTAIVNIVPIGSLPPEPLASSLPEVIAQIVPVIESVALDELATTAAPVADPVQTSTAVADLSADGRQVEEIETPQLVVKIDPPLVELIQAADEIEIETVSAITPPIDVAEELPENRRRKRRSSAVVD